MKRSAKIVRLQPPAGSPHSVRVPKAAELIADALRQRIAQGDLQEGDALPSEADLIVDFSVSRASLREALRILETEGLIEVKRGAQGGARIRLPREDNAAKSLGLLLQVRGATLKDMFDARLILEPPLMNQLAQNRTEDDLAVIRAHLERERKIVDNSKLFAPAAAEFHRILVSRAGNIALAIIVGMLDELYLRHLNQFISSGRRDLPTLNNHSYTNHSQLLDALVARDGPGAEVIWRYHMQNARKIILEELGESSPLSLY
ncbi:transcriptional regulator of GntR family [alpha proteobacterium U9-1i]|nr:transcriptional regulator of GntR family [alpha proteobacterium U9-1i]